MFLEFVEAGANLCEEHFKIISWADNARYKTGTLFIGEGVLAM